MHDCKDEQRSREVRTGGEGGKAQDAFKDASWRQMTEQGSETVSQKAPKGWARDGCWISMRVQEASNFYTADHMMQEM